VFTGHPSLLWRGHVTGCGTGCASLRDAYVTAQAGR
jgi:hypothetical protein